jgi:hypothetical protein
VSKPYVKGEERTVTSSRKGVKERIRLLEEEKQLMVIDPVAAIMHEEKRHQRTMLKLLKNWAKVEPQRVLERPANIPKDKPAPSNGNTVAPMYDPEAVRRRADEMAKRLNPSVTAEPASTNGHGAEPAPAPDPANGNGLESVREHNARILARTPKPDKVSGYIEELEAHYAQSRQASDAAREKEERRARIMESRLRRW